LENARLGDRERDIRIILSIVSANSVPDINWPDRNHDNPPPSSAEVKNSRNYASIHPVTLHVVVRPITGFGITCVET